MNDWDSTDQKPWTWGAFYQQVKADGVTLRTINDAIGGYQPPIVVMERRGGDGAVRRVILPEGCTPDRRMMLIRYEATCRGLGVPVRKWVAVM